ncbi:MAG TPA: DUF4247 domain-containing protein [Bacillales bacterium]|nr:DUF4247 domain-containing protein [Bacillales bacterium]
MRKRSIGLLLLLVLVLGGCGNSIQGVIAKKYPLKDTVQSSANSGDAAKVYLAKGQSISQVAQFLRQQKQPKKASGVKNGKAVLVYDNNFVTLTKNKKNPDSTDIEVASYTFVRDNYRPSFFNGLLTGYFLSSLFNVPDWGARQSYRCQSALNPCYGGYRHSGGHYKGPRRPPSFRGSLSGPGFFRGGGPNVGK